MSTVGTMEALLERPLLESLPAEFVCDFSVDLGPPLLISTPRGKLVQYIGKGRRVEGPRLRGEFLTSVDWVVLGTDGMTRLDIRGSIRTDDGALIYFETRGVVRLPPDGRERLMNGVRLEFEETYVRTTPKLETSDERYSWLNDFVFVSHNELSLAPPRMDFRMYRIL